MSKIMNETTHRVKEKYKEKRAMGEETVALVPGLLSLTCFSQLT